MWLCWLDALDKANRIEYAYNELDTVFCSIHSHGSSSSPSSSSYCVPVYIKQRRFREMSLHYSYLCNLWDGFDSIFCMLFIWFRCQDRRYNMWSSYCALFINRTNHVPVSVLLLRLLLCLRSTHFASLYIFAGCICFTICTQFIFAMWQIKRNHCNANNAYFANCRLYTHNFADM